MGNYHSNHHSNQGISQLNYLSMWPHLVPLVLLKPVHSVFSHVGLQILVSTSHYVSLYSQHV